MGFDTSMDAAEARDGARDAALEDLAIKVEVCVKIVAETYVLRTRKDAKGASGKSTSEEIQKRRERLIETSVNQTLRGLETICDEMTLDPTSQDYTYYIVLQINTDKVLKDVFNNIKKDPDVKDDIPANYEKFRETYERVQSNYNGSY